MWLLEITHTLLLGVLTESIVSVQSTVRRWREMRSLICPLTHKLSPPPPPPNNCKRDTTLQMSIIIVLYYYNIATCNCSLKSPSPSTPQLAIYTC